MKLRHREINRALQEIITRAQGLERDCEMFCRRANDDMDAGFNPTSEAGHRGSRSGHSDPVASKATSGRRDQVAASAEALVRGIRVALAEIQRADRAGFSLLALSDDEAKALTNDEVAHKAEDQTLSATCANLYCQRPVARTANDRLREGRCENCYRYRHTHGEERPRLYCDAERNIASAFELDQERVIVEGAA